MTTRLLQTTGATYEIYGKQYKGHPPKCNPLRETWMGDALNLNP